MGRNRLARLLADFGIAVASDFEPAPTVALVEFELLGHEINLVGRNGQLQFAAAVRERLLVNKNAVDECFAVLILVHIAFG